MSNNRLKVLRMLSNSGQSDWKIGKSDEFISAVSAKINTLPSSVFSNFSIKAGSDKKISIIDFALMTYEMSYVDRNALMELYGIDSDTIKNILHTADEIAEIMEGQTIEEPISPVIPASYKNKSNDFDEI